MQTTPTTVMSTLTVTIPWGPITVLVTLNILEMAPHAQVNSWIIHYLLPYFVVIEMLLGFQMSFSDV